MKISSTLGLVGVVAILSFFVGRKSAPTSIDDERSGKAEVSDRYRLSSASGSRDSGDFDIGKSAREAAASGGNLTEEQCRALTREERLELLKKGALIFDSLKQAAYVEGVIKTLDEEELASALEIFGKAQDRGNWPAQAIWDAMWKHSGRLSPEKTLATFDHHQTRSDARFIMEGWMEVDPVAAMAWARSPKESKHDAAAAAYALTKNANGDPEKLLETLSKFPADDLVLKDCLQDYFDMADITGTSEGTGAIYDELPASLKEQAWGVTMRRLSYTDAQEAIDWLGDHAEDPGADYSQTRRLFRELAMKDPVGMTTWATTLPSLKKGETHPTEMSYLEWVRIDQPAALTWLKGVENKEAWADNLRAKFIPRMIDQGVFIPGR